MNRSWFRAHDLPLSQGVLKEQNTDFIVTERLPEQPSGEGEHIWLTIEKDGQNTAWVARQLAKWAGVKPRDVSYAGLKDRHAVTRQTFSVHLPGKVSPSTHLIHIDGVKLIDAQRHSRKLKTGQLIGNHFSIRLRQVSQSLEAIQQNWQKVITDGVPNYFGPQRFGFAGQNVEKGVDWILGRESAPRQHQSIYLSAVRSYLFNHLLEQRVKDGTWNRLIAGDFVQFTEGKSGFYCEQPEENDHARCDSGQLSACASLPGSIKEVFSTLDQRESQQLEPYESWVQALEQKNVARQFRKLRLLPENAQFEIVEGDPVLQFFLPAGSFATTVLSELFQWSDRHQESSVE
jgi:tRNA pseudouridine13 synthase